jgi:hypothetical protein
MKASINFPQIKHKVMNATASKKRVLEVVTEKIEKDKSVFLSKFENHPVTQEISVGPRASNISNTLGGRGNLFSFIGFPESSTNPTLAVKDLIKNKIYLLRKVLASKNSFVATVRIPDLDEFSNITRMPWEPGRSWLLDIEKRISGLGSYLFGEFRRSRSGAGIQTDKAYSSASFRSVKYFRSMYLDFINRIQKK